MRGELGEARVMDAVLQHLPPSCFAPPGVQLVCYGLGRFLSERIAQYQLALLLLLRDGTRAAQVEVFDPVHGEVRGLQRQSRRCALSTARVRRSEMCLCA